MSNHSLADQTRLSYGQGVWGVCPAPTLGCRLSYDDFFFDSLIQAL